MTAAPALVPLEAIERELIRRRGLAEFVRRAWPQVDTSPLVWGWHLDAVCEHLEAVQRREIRDLAIHEPPGLGKSLIVSVLFPAWVWTLDPEHRWLAFSYGDKVALRDSQRMRALVASDWYRERWPEVQLPRARDASTALSLWHNTRGGLRLSTTISGQVTGHHGDTAVIDDPIDPRGADAVSGVGLDEVLRWWSTTLPTRFRDHPRSARVLVMQRLHERDLGAEMHRQGATVLCLPMRYESKHPQRWACDPRTTEGALLAPQRMPAEELDKVEARMGPTVVAAQHQQRPSPAGGAIFKKEHLARTWTELPTDGYWLQSWDCAFKDTESSDFVCGQVWCTDGTNFYLVDQVHERLSFSKTCERIQSLSKTWPKARTKLVEDKANGSAVIDALKAKLPGLEPVQPEGGKIARAHAVEGLFAAGNVLLPQSAPWVEQYRAELLAFPRGAHDDQVDATTQALGRMSNSYLSRMVRALTKKAG